MKIFSPRGSPLVRWRRVELSTCDGTTNTSCPLDLAPRKSDVARSHILGGERVAEQRLVGEVASSHAQPVPDVRRSDVNTSSILHIPDERVWVEVNCTCTRCLDDQVGLVQRHVDGVHVDVCRCGCIPVGCVWHGARPWRHSTQKKIFIIYTWNSSMVN